MHAEIVKGRAHWTARFHAKGNVTLTDKQLRGSRYDAVRAVKNHVTQVYRQCTGDRKAIVQFKLVEVTPKLWKIEWDSWHPKGVTQ